jgi:hypothetical protein
MPGPFSFCSTQRLIVNDLDPLDSPVNGQRARYVDREKFPGGNRISSKCYLVTLKKPMIGTIIARIIVAGLFKRGLRFAVHFWGRFPVAAGPGSS